MPNEKRFVKRSACFNRSATNARARAEAAIEALAKIAEEPVQFYHELIQRKGPHLDTLRRYEDSVDDLYETIANKIGARCMSVVVVSNGMKILPQKNVEDTFRYIHLYVYPEEIQEALPHYVRDILSLDNRQRDFQRCYDKLLPKLGELKARTQSPPDGSSDEAVILTYTQDLREELAERYKLIGLFANHEIAKDPKDTGKISTITQNVNSMRIQYQLVIRCLKQLKDKHKTHHPRFTSSYQQELLTQIDDLLGQLYGISQDLLGYLDHLLTDLKKDVNDFARTFKLDTKRKKCEFLIEISSADDCFDEEEDHLYLVDGLPRSGSPEEAAFDDKLKKLIR